jgi:hypothetical protein
LTARRPDPKAELRAVSEEISDRAIKAGEVTKNSKHERSLRMFSRLHHLSDRLLPLSNKVTLSDAEYVEEDVINFALALEFVAECCFLLLFWKLRESTDVFRFNFIRHNREALKRSLIARRELKTPIEHSSGAINVVGAESEVIPTDSLKGERHKSVSRWIDTTRPLLGVYLSNMIEV